MAGTEFELSEITDDQIWDRLVAMSPQGTVFSSSAFVNALGYPNRRLAVTSNCRTLAVCCAVENEAGTALIAPHFTPYQGILFIGEPSRLNRKRILDQFRITEFLIGQLTQRYASIRMRLSWMVDDLRPFQWHNYHGPQDARFRLAPYYTATLRLTGTDDAMLMADLRSCRRQEVRKTSDFAITEEKDVVSFVNLYRQTFLRQGVELDESKVALVHRISTAAIEKGFGTLTQCKEGDDIVSMTLFVSDARRSYYLFGANNPDKRNTGGSTRLVLENILRARAAGLAELDFVGVNSPQRGEFKLSFNPELRLYFQADYGS